MACAIIHAWVQPLRTGVDVHNQWAVGHGSRREECLSDHQLGSVLIQQLRACMDGTESFTVAFPLTWLTTRTINVDL
ncbi:hypothetical protein D3C84_938660 [compost metagenome]